MNVAYKTAPPFLHAVFIVNTFTQSDEVGGRYCMENEGLKGGLELLEENDVHHY